MKIFISALVVTAFLVLTCTTISRSWGFWAHQRINRMAVFSVHPSMFKFFKHHIDYLTIHAVDPDKRRYAVEGEAACHFIDLDRYGEHPLDSIPMYWKDAVAKYTEDTLMEHGIVPWHIEKMMYRLTNAFRDKNYAKILKYAADIGHYIGDAHVPLHCTQNYNGQLTNQHGIHGLWESRVPELIGEEFDYFTGKCQYIENPLKAAWQIIAGSYQAHDSVLLFEKKLNAEFPKGRKYAYEQKGNVTMKVYSAEYALTYDRMLNGMAERRMRDAIQMVASFWYTAWVNAGQPDLEIETVINPTDTISTEQNNNVPEKLKSKIKGHDD